MNIDRTKKIKKVDCVLLHNDIDFLIFRLEESYDDFDHFIVIETINYDIDKSKFNENSNKFDKWLDKIIYLPIECSLEELSTDEYKSKQFEGLSKILETLPLSFDDIIIVSNENEFPVIDNLTILQEFLSFDPVVFSMTNFLWSTDYIKKERHLGSFCFSYSHFIVHKKKISEIWVRKNDDNISFVNEVVSGYFFEYFYSEEKALEEIMKTSETTDEKVIMTKIKKSRKDLVYFDFKNDGRENPLKKYVGPLPKNIHIINSQKIGRITPRKNCIVIGFDSLLSITEKFDNVIVIKPTESIWTKDSEIVNDTTKIFYITIPKTQYYEILIDENNLKNFQKMFLFNEIKKRLNSYCPLDIDEFHFYIGGKPIIKTWSEIQDSFVYDLIYN